MARSGDDWDELTERTRQRKQTRRKRGRRQRSKEEQADDDHDNRHTSKFISDLAKKDSQYNWMKEEKKFCTQCSFNVVDWYLETF